MSKTNYKWIIGILLITNVLIFTFKFGSNEKLTNYISFAGTLISIVLAILAIIYSYYQNSTYENSTTKLNESANNIKELTEKVENSINVLTEKIEKTNNLDTTIKTISTVLDTVRDMASDIQQQHQITNKKIENFGNNLINLSRPMNNKDTDINITYTKEQLYIIAKDSSYEVLSLFYYISKCYKNNKYINMTDFTKMMYNNFKDSEEMALRGIFAGYLNAFHTFNILTLDINRETHQMFIKYFNEEFINTIEDEIISNKELTLEKKNLKFGVLIENIDKFIMNHPTK